MSARQGGRAARARSRRHAAADRRRAVHQDGEPPDGHDHRSGRVHRQGRGSLRLARQARPLRRFGEACAREARRELVCQEARAGDRLLGVPHRSRHRDLLERHAPLRRDHPSRSQRWCQRAVRSHRHRPGLGLDPGLSDRGSSRHRAEGHPRAAGRHDPDARRSGLLLVARDADVWHGGDPGRPASPRRHLQGGGAEARGEPGGPRGARAQDRRARRLGPSRAIRARRGARGGATRCPRVSRLVRAAQARRQVQGRRRRAVAVLLVFGVCRGADRRRRDRHRRPRERVDRPRHRPRAESAPGRGTGRGLGVHGDR